MAALKQGRSRMSGSGQRARARKNGYTDGSAQQRPDRSDETTVTPAASYAMLSISMK